jgi:hypothetical protein
MIPNDVSWIFDFKKSQKMSKDAFPILKLVANTSLFSSDFKSLVLDEDHFYVIMTSKRPNLTYQGTVASKQDKKSKEIDNQRMVIQNSQIYYLDLEFLSKS